MYNERMENGKLKTQSIREIKVATPPPNAHRVSFGDFMWLKHLQRLCWRRF